MSVAHQPPAAIIGELVGMAAEQARNLGLDGLRQNRSRAVAQNLGQRIAKSSWLRELENISVGHGVSLLCWRSGGVEHPHDTPPYPFTPSPTFAHSSFDPDSGESHGTIPINTGEQQAGGLWMVDFGVGGNAGSPDVLYFTDGINGEANGLFGAIAIHF